MHSGCRPSLEGTRVLYTCTSSPMICPVDGPTQGRHEETRRKTRRGKRQRAKIKQQSYVQLVGQGRGQAEIKGQKAMTIKTKAQGHKNKPTSKNRWCVCLTDAASFCTSLTATSHPRYLHTRAIDINRSYTTKIQHPPTQTRADAIVLTSRLRVFPLHYKIVLVIKKNGVALILIIVYFSWLVNHKCLIMWFVWRIVYYTKTQIYHCMEFSVVIPKSIRQIREQKHIQLVCMASSMPC